MSRLPRFKEAGVHRRRQASKTATPLKVVILPQLFRERENGCR